MPEKRCFVIAPIGSTGSQTRERSDKVLRELIRPAALECGYIASRGDEIDEPGLITSQTIRRVREDPLVIADLTEHNPNVFYELAIRHAVRRPIVQLIEEGEKIPFDVSGMRTIRFNHRDRDSIREARQKVVRQIRVLEKGREELHSPIEALVDLRVEGKRLFQHRGYYPIDINPEDNVPSLNREIFIRAMNYFTEDENYDRLAAMDLVYLREDNLVDGDILRDEDLPLYESLVEKYNLLDFIVNRPQEDERIFANFVRIVNDLGDTLSNVYFEVLLHNVRNPIRSIIAARNSENISGRKLFDPSTRFVVQYVKNQGRELIRAMQGRGKVSYLKQFNRVKQVKATTTPLYHEQYGLVGILCFNIDIDAVRELDQKGLGKFLESYTKNSGQTPAFEREDWGLT